MQIHPPPTLSNLTAAEIAKKDCFVATLQTLDNDIVFLSKYNHFPVVDSEWRFQFYISGNSSWQNWAQSQDYEIDFWQTTYSRNFFANNEIQNDTDISFRISDNSVVEAIRKHLCGVVIEVGAGPLMGRVIDGLAHDSERWIVIEPLAKKYAQLCKERSIVIPDKAKVDVYSNDASVLIPELINTADLIICESALDHTPDWPFVLGNIARYTKLGGIFALSTDIDHQVSASNHLGHYNITYNPNKLYHLLEALGFELIYKNCYTRTIGKTWLVAVGVKKGVLT